MYTNPRNAGTSRNRNEWGIITLSVCALLVLTHCDSGFVPDVGPPPNSSDARIEQIKAWYDTALEEEQDAHLDPQRVGKLAGDSTLLSDSTIAAVLAAMVDKHSPDWDQMETWDNGSGGYIGATLLAGGPGGASDPDLSVVRTLVADVDEDGRVLSGYLVEFVSEDAQESQFKEYVEQWLAGDFGNKPMLIAEYTVGYASTSAMFYAPDKAPIPVTMQLVEKIGTGKTAAEIWYCYVTVYREGEVCVHGSDWGVCTAEIYTETTCVCVSGCDDTGDGGDDGDGCPPEGCDTGGDDDDDDNSDDDDDEDETEDITFDFSCDKSVTRGESAGCTVKVTYAEGVEEKQHTFDWSTPDTTLSTQDANGSEWRGTATQDVTITLIVGEKKYSGDISVAARTDFTGFSIPALNVTNVQYVPLASIGLYSIWRSETVPVGSPIAGTGPWSGTYTTGELDTSVDFYAELEISDDYHPTDSLQPTYSAPHNIDSTDCANAVQLDTDSQSYSSVNLFCGTVAGYEEMGSLILKHEYEHQTNANACLAETTIFDSMEGMVGTDDEELSDALDDAWEDFIGEFDASAAHAGSYKVSSDYFARPTGSGWVLYRHEVQGHGTATRPKCN